MTAADNQPPSSKAGEDAAKIKPPSEREKISVAVTEDMTAEELDQLLTEDDPSFLQSMQGISQDKNLTMPEIVIPPEEESRLKRIKFRGRMILRAIWIWSKNFAYFMATEGKAKTLGRMKAWIAGKLDDFSEARRNFRYLSIKLKLAFLGILILVAGTGFFIYRSWTHGVLKSQDQLFIHSLENVAGKVFEYDPETELEPFYENLRVSGNTYLLPKMVVNLRRSAQSGRNPMGAFEFYVEGMIPEVVVEVKDREVEIRDLMQRVLEELTFDQVASVDGKKLMAEKLKKELNAVLTTGKIKQVWIKTLIVKP
ncbi:MAG: hypothetical protein COT73_10240 [Bdellovibrio sp. CG10_big_fil_rev_8_21_14_0_10_47_8]|nr:MAG: hypothetical protein COT73_10240 [Bdellovibrio sp. CG10_big_fil_rev_8_21_14_0_10_47_8]